MYLLQRSECKMSWTWCTSFFERFLRQKLIMSRRHGRQRFFSLLYGLALRRSLQAAQLFSVSVFFTEWVGTTLSALRCARRDVSDDARPNLISFRCAHADGFHSSRSTGGRRKRCDVIKASFHDLPKSNNCQRFSRAR